MVRPKEAALRWRIIALEFIADLRSEHYAVASRRCAHLRSWASTVPSEAESRSAVVELGGFGIRPFDCSAGKSHRVTGSWVHLSIRKRKNPSQVTRCVFSTYRMGNVRLERNAQKILWDRTERPPVGVGPALASPRPSLRPLTGIGIATLDRRQSLGVDHPIRLVDHPDPLTPIAGWWTRADERQRLPRPPPDPPGPPRRVSLIAEHGPKIRLEETRSTIRIA